MMDFLEDLQWKKAISIAVVLGTMLAGFISTQVMSKEDASMAYSGKLPVEQVTVELQGGGVHGFSLEVVSKPVDIQMGLMFREKMGKDQGMLFEMGAPQLTAFWMKNTLIPLDMLFVAEDGTIINIHQNAEPHSLTPIPSNGEVTGVIELNGGRAKALNIKVGDRVLHPYFKQTVKK
ncbi:MAG: DUF192 domain-containing protein [Alphaproteobacteria bacterium]|nr:DUF192 domain-containing protein [Alphaproteobacteria bacterium]